MSSTSGHFETGQSLALESVRARLEELATKVVLGGLDPAEWTALLSAFRGEAEAAGLSGLARVAIESLGNVPSANSSGIEATYSETVKRIQQAFPTRPPELPSPKQNSDLPPPAALPALSASLCEDKETLNDFILESREHLARVETHSMTLEKDPDDAEAINTVFRSFHTIKGLAGFMELVDIQAVSHETESLLDLARNGKLRITPGVIDIVLAATDFLQISLSRLEAALAGTVLGAAPDKSTLIERIRSGALVNSARPAAESILQPPVESGPSAASEDKGAPATNSDWVERRTGGDRRKQENDALSVRVDTAKLDFLVDMVGELVIAQSMLRHQPELENLRSPTVLRSMAQFARITSDLQKTAMSMRMVPVNGLFQRMTRVARDLTRKTGKQAEVETIGGDTELDRSVVEELADPLMHMIRNAIDHGLESSEERRIAGKNPIGKIRLRASHQAGHIVIEIADDGRGLNREKIFEKARRTGLLDEGSNPSDREVFNLIFHPGFSTAARITDVSGRGVGMDVVKKQIQKLRGHVDIESRPGKGTSFFLRLPLTLAMIDGLVVGVGSERYVVPLFSVREMLRPSADTVFTVEGHHEMALVRNSLLPVIRLYQRFGVRPRSESATESLLIVGEAAGRTFCLIVDELIGKQEVVIKSLGGNLQNISGVAGGTILGDGRVGLILDLEGIFRAGDK
ncbi:MAG TPA: chemotaxis protein CheA [Terracidiphilus sp.]|nr:chemotaxis protein CheA [Terracidiphilus sp.]